MVIKIFYLTGIDFIKEKGNPYAFHHQTENIIKLLPYFFKNKSQSDIHSMEYDLNVTLFFTKNIME